MPCRAALPQMLIFMFLASELQSVVAIAPANFFISPSFKSPPGWQPLRSNEQIQAADTARSPSPARRARRRSDRHGRDDGGAYTVDEAALRHGAGVERETIDATEAYA